MLANCAQVVIDTRGGTDRPGTLEIAGLAKDMPLSEEARRSYARTLDAGPGRFDGASLSRLLVGG